MTKPFILMVIAFLIVLTAFINLHNTTHSLVDSCNELIVACNERGAIIEHMSEIIRGSSQSQEPIYTKTEVMYCPFCVPISENIMRYVGNEWYVKIHGSWKWLSKKFMSKHGRLLASRLYELDNLKEIQQRRELIK